MGQVAFTELLVLILAGLGERADHWGLWQASVAFGVGAILFALLAFTH